MKRYALDLETYLISDENPLPKPVCLSWWNLDDPEDHGVSANHFSNNAPSMKLSLEYFLGTGVWEDEEQKELIWQNGYAFDLPVIYTHFPQLRERLLQTLNEGWHKDTKIRQQLYDLSTKGQIKRKGYSLATMAKQYLGKDLDKWKKGDDIWRLRYSELDGVPVENYPKEALEYCLLDVEVLAGVYKGQEAIRQSEGYGSMNTEALQIKAGFALSLATAKGIQVNKQRLDEFEHTIDSQLDPLKLKLMELGFADTKATKKKDTGLTTFRYTKKNKLFLDYLQNNYPDYVSRTEATKTHPKGQIRVDEEALLEYPEDEVIKTRLEMSLLEKYKGTYCKNIRKANGLLRANYDILKETGRTSSFIQVMPREGGVREIFEPREGHVFATIDYAAIEACSIAQTAKDLNLGSTLLDYLNHGNSPRDYHSLLGHLWYAYENSEEPNIEAFEKGRKTNKKMKEARNDSKPVGLSEWGGVGLEKRVKICKGQGRDLTIEQVETATRLYEEAVPEKRVYLKDWVNQQKLSGDFDYAYAYTVNGRYRNRCTYCACANGRAMQSPAADGAKEAIWQCFLLLEDRGYGSFVGFVHDELIFELRKDKAEEASQELAKAMCLGMQKILPNVRISTEWGIMDRWTKDESLFLASGKVWNDPKKEVRV